MRYGLSEEQLKEITETLASFDEIEAAILFGSRAIGTFKEASDIDIAIKGKNVDFSLASNIEGDFEESDLPFFFDIIAWPTITSKDLKKHIWNRGKVIYRRGWRETKLGNCIDIKHGYAFKGEGISKLNNNNILVTPGNFDIGGGFKKSKLKYFKGKIPKDYILEKNDIVVTMTDLSKDSDTLGYSAKIPKSIKDEIYLHNQRIGLVQLRKNNIEKDFLYWLMRTNDYHSFIVGASTGTAIRHTSPTTIREYKFSLPPLAEQKTIAETLGSLDDKIELLHRQNKTLEDMAQALFQKWFVEGADESWEQKPLDTVANYLNGLACQKYPPKNDKEKLPVLKIRELKDGITNKSDWVTSKIDNKYIVELGDIIFSWSRSLELKIWNGQRCALNQHLFKITSECYPKWFYYLWTNFYLEKFRQIADGKATTMGHIKRGDLSKSMVLAPSKFILSDMNENMEHLFDKIISNYKKIIISKKTREILLPKLMSGQIGVS